ncbi:hypothetical protein [uncultured Lactobacillus sp.]|uniref:hypothetical protein n=1 Tax=uncultured Lactobacillus sp. TaxID=153152 RepID=UPI0025CE5654|nr:hypothetical protein [uncultured Lactobacillus sp.]
MKHIKYLTFLALSILGIAVLSGKAYAATDDEVTTLYNKGVATQKIDSSQYSLSDFKEFVQEAETNLGVQSGNSKISVESFLELDNYGAMPDGSSPYSKSSTSSNIYRAPMLRASSSRKTTFTNKIQKGDILIIGGTFGHAAIATTNKYVLEMPGGGNIVNWLWTQLKDNNSQKTKTHWIDYWSKKAGKNKIQIWRPKDKAMREKVANYADYRFWSSTHSLTKNRHINYQIIQGTSGFNPNYCSRMVWQAFYHGSGNKNVIQTSTAGLTYIFPGALVNTFTSKYRPYKVGTY